MNGNLSNSDRVPGDRARLAAARTGTTRCTKYSPCMASRGVGPFALISNLDAARSGEAHGTDKRRCSCDPIQTLSLIPSLPCLRDRWREGLELVHGSTNFDHVHVFHNVTWVFLDDTGLFGERRSFAAVAHRGYIHGEYITQSIYYNFRMEVAHKIRVLAKSLFI